ncbi:hypothetical protein OCH239_16630 [Roseivivax halodurans JCM 10272]|uniref:Co-chaperone DjlA N-terminal domain-containing protein n=1 Tax=Roseivivax halodurans JCM 10272 TaxID=1449350 RepID=X7EJW0_9RHOB|nr:hypothetical protein [Roseivivax halodurans]ETX15446.1 hypothetical protein OCH239_16630 [Roseivivax halodurans JCM 10272]
MSSRLIYWATMPEMAWLDPADTPVALGTLTVRAASGELADLLPEAEHIDAVLARRYDLTATEAAEMRRVCEHVASAVPCGRTYARLVTENVPAEERRAFAESLLHVAAEGRTDPWTAASVARAFGLPDVALPHARRA